MANQLENVHNINRAQTQISDWMGGREFVEKRDYVHNSQFHKKISKQKSETDWPVDADPRESVDRWAEKRYLQVCSTLADQRIGAEELPLRVEGRVDTERNDEQGT